MMLRVGFLSALETKAAEDKANAIAEMTRLDEMAMKAQEKIKTAKEAAEYAKKIARDLRNNAKAVKADEEAVDAGTGG